MIDPVGLVRSVDTRDMEVDGAQCLVTQRDNNDITGTYMYIP